MEFIVPPCLLKLLEPEQGWSQKVLGEEEIQCLLALGLLKL